MNPVETQPAIVILMANAFKFSDVTEGYRTTPSSFSKCYSTGDIFRSSRDIMRDVYTPDALSAAKSGILHSASQKRTRSQSDDGYESDSVIFEEECMDEATDCAEGLDAMHSARPIKGLRTRPLGVMGTRSLPAGHLGLPVSNLGSDVAMKEEEDWSLNLVDMQALPASLEPLVLPGC